ncbi:ABC transporter permease [Actinoplanes sp. NPDC051859]|uniref:ABC transporter permease n=1 Tax=Actinoplanes sp. NPDC051859 TaxID=3363909 RepID=UPI0037AF3AAA
MSIRTDNRPSYTSFGLAWLMGYGALALDAGSDPITDLPGQLPGILLAVGIAAALGVTCVSIMKAQRGVEGTAALQGTLSGAGWVVGFTALFLLITSLEGFLAEHHVGTVLWPTGSALVVGLLYLLGGTIGRDLHQYALGVYLALVGGAAAFLGLTGMYALLALAGAAGYFIAAAAERRRLAVAV